MDTHCETCGRTHDGKYGSGRFCSSSCARSAGGQAFRRNRELQSERENLKIVMSLKFVLNPEIYENSRI